MQTKRTICVYCGSKEGPNPAYGQAADQLGQRLGQRGWDLVYGGGHVGLMGRLADAAVASGSRVIGVIPRPLQDRELGHGGIDELAVVEDMHQRKAMMAAKADAFLTLPGGYGTLEELFEVIAWSQLQLHQKPVGLLNIEGYYDPLLAFIDRAVNEQFIHREHRDLLLVEDQVDTILERLSQALGSIL